MDGAPLTRDVHAVTHHRHLKKSTVDKVSNCFGHLAEEGELVVGEESVGFVHEEVSPDELLEAPVFALNEPERQ